MLKDYKENKPTIEANRVILKPMVVEHAADLKQWLGLDEIYTYWGRKATSGEKNSETMFKKSLSSCLLYTSPSPRDCS